MEINEYVKEVIKLESKDMDLIGVRFSNPDTQRLIHGMIGLCTETGEIQDQVKKHLFYGKELDLVNLKEEIGDLFFYVIIMCDVLNVNFTEILDLNFKKLSARYPGGFTNERALNRNQTFERKVLENLNEI